MEANYEITQFFSNKKGKNEHLFFNICYVYQVIFLEEVSQLS